MYYQYFSSRSHLLWNCDKNYRDYCNENRLIPFLIYWKGPI